MATKELQRRPVGRPAWEYDAEIADEICSLIATSTLGLKAICLANPLWPSEAVVRKWLTFNDEFANCYARARHQQADILAEEVIEISDASNADLEIGTARDGSPRLIINGEAVQRSKLKADNRKWLAGKLNSRYGDKLDVTSDGKALAPPNSVTIDARVQTIMLMAERRRLAASLFDEEE